MWYWLRSRWPYYKESDKKSLRLSSICEKLTVYIMCTRPWKNTREGKLAIIRQVLRVWIRLLLGIHKDWLHVRNPGFIDKASSKINPNPEIKVIHSLFNPHVLRISLETNRYSQDSPRQDDYVLSKLSHCLLLISHDDFFLWWIGGFIPEGISWNI
jgi:hypothetical protein